ncbi:MAG: peptidoglycan DD-metalloendopeptidase family protein, partial [Roseovarius indicus]
GTVAAITEDTNGIPIIVVKHPDNLLTVYSNVGGVAVSKGDSVSRGQKLAEIRSDGTAAVHFEVREGFDSVDPGPYLQ